MRGWRPQADFCTKSCTFAVSLNRYHLHYSVPRPLENGDTSYIQESNPHLRRILIQAAHGAKLKRGSFYRNKKVLPVKKLKVDTTGVTLQ
jgi:hypothetical protein